MRSFWLLKTGFARIIEETSSNLSVYKEETSLIISKQILSQKFGQLEICSRW